MLRLCPRRANLMGVMPSNKRLRIFKVLRRRDSSPSAQDEITTGVLYAGGAWHSYCGIHRREDPDGYGTSCKRQFDDFRSPRFAAGGDAAAGVLSQTAGQREPQRNPYLASLLCRRAGLQGEESGALLVSRLLDLEKRRYFFRKSCASTGAWRRRCTSACCRSPSTIWVGGSAVGPSRRSIPW